MLVFAALPGVDPEHIAVTLSNGMLLITGRTRAAAAADDGRDSTGSSCRRGVSSDKCRCQPAGMRLRGPRSSMVASPSLCANSSDRGYSICLVFLNLSSRRTPARAAAVASPRVDLPQDALIIVPVRGFVLFPGVVMPVTVGRAPNRSPQRKRPSGKDVQSAFSCSAMANDEDALPLNMHRMGVVASVLRYIAAPDGRSSFDLPGRTTLLCRGVRQGAALPRREGCDGIEESDARSPDIEARFVHLQGQAAEALQLLPQTPNELIAAVNGASTPAGLTDLVAAYMDATPEQKQDILETIDLPARMDKVARLLAQRIEVLRLSQEIGRQTKASLDERQREMLLREQMASIQRQLGEGDGKAQEIAELTGAIAKANMPPEVDQAARKELLTGSSECPTPPPNSA